MAKHTHSATLFISGPHLPQILARCLESKEEEEESGSSPSHASISQKLDHTVVAKRGREDTVLSKSGVVVRVNKQTNAVLQRRP